ncbi:MAG TPA: flagellar protein FlaG [bacterium]|nr:flagellar protein FlaG [bacterium]
MMRIEIASNLQTNSIYGDRRAAAAARTNDERQSASADARATEVKASSVGLGQASDRTGSIRDEAASVQRPAPVEETDDNARSSTAESSPARTEDDLKEFISMLNELSQMSKNQLEFEFEPEEEISVIRVVDAETGEMVRRIPPEKLLAAMNQVFDMLGIVLDKTA